MKKLLNCLIKEKYTLWTKR